MKLTYRSVFLFAFLFTGYILKAEGIIKLNLSRASLEIIGNNKIVKKAAEILDKEVYTRSEIHFNSANKEIAQIKLLVGVCRQINLH